VEFLSIPMEIPMAKKKFLGPELDKHPRISEEDWILLILAHEKKGDPSDCVALMNEVFFFIKEIASAMTEEFGFRGTGSGPYSPTVAETVDKLVSENMLEIKNEMNTGTRFYSPTEKGNAKARSVLKNLSEKEQEKIRFAHFLAQRMGSMGTLQYLSSVHPEYVFIDKTGDVPV
jgi:uncharacterized protein YwgA